MKDRPPVPPESLSVVLPCRNEEGNVRRVVGEVIERLGPCVGWLEVVVVNDGSGDGTGAVAAAVAEEMRSERVRVVVVTHEVNRGYGAALRSGFAAAAGDWVFYTDGDGQFDMGQLPALFPLLRECDMVIGRRVRRMDPPHRRLFGACWTLLVDVIFGLRYRDIDCAFKVMPRAFVQGAGLVSDGAMISTELLARAKRAGLRVKQVGVEHRARVAGRAGGGDLSVIRRAFGELVALRRVLAREDREPARAGKQGVDA